MGLVGVRTFPSAVHLHFHFCTVFSGLGLLFGFRGGEEKEKKRADDLIAMSNIGTSNIVATAATTTAMMTTSMMASSTSSAGGMALATQAPVLAVGAAVAFAHGVM